MKRLFITLLLGLMASFSYGQSLQNKYHESAVKADSITMSRFKAEFKEADKAFEKENTVEIIIPATVLEIHGKDAVIVSRNYGKHFLISSGGLTVGKEYKFKLSFLKELRELYHCSGCTGILPAKRLGYAYTERQARLDAQQLQDDPGGGYSRSPRY